MNRSNFLEVRGVNASDNPVPSPGIGIIENTVACVVELVVVADDERHPPEDGSVDVADDWLLLEGCTELAVEIFFANR